MALEFIKTYTAATDVGSPAQTVVSRPEPQIDLWNQARSPNTWNWQMLDNRTRIVIRCSFLPAYMCTERNLSVLVHPSPPPAPTLLLIQFPIGFQLTKIYANSVKENNLNFVPRFPKWINWNWMIWYKWRVGWNKMETRRKGQRDELLRMLQ